MKILGFDWDETNQEKLELHDLNSEDVEELLESGQPYIFQRDGGRYIALGHVPDGRFILVVFELDQETRWVRVVTAYEPTSPGWWKRYAKAKGLDER